MNGETREEAAEDDVSRGWDLLWRALLSVTFLVGFLRKKLRSEPSIVSGSENA